MSQQTLSAAALSEWNTSVRREGGLEEVVSSNSIYMYTCTRVLYIPPFFFLPSALYPLPLLRPFLPPLIPSPSCSSSSSSSSSPALHDTLEGKEHVVEFDFLGKDSIRYYNRVPVERQVFKNLGHFMRGKEPGDDLFDRLTVSIQEQGGRKSCLRGWPGGIGV